MSLYKEEVPFLKDDLLNEKEDLQEKLDFLDKKFHHLDFKIVSEFGAEIEFDKFLAKTVLAHIRKAMIEKILHHDRELIKLEEKESV